MRKSLRWLNGCGGNGGDWKQPGGSNQAVVLTFCPRWDGRLAAPDAGFGNALMSAAAPCACAFSAFFNTDMPTASPVTWLETAAKAELETSMTYTS